MRHSSNQYKYAIRRLKRANDKIQNDKFLSSISGGGVDIFDEIRKFRGSSKTCSSRVDDEVGSSNIANHFAGIYSQLYNQSEHGQPFSDLCDQVSHGAGQGGLQQVGRVTEEVVAKALKMMKGNKNDALFDFQSDCLINGPPELVHHLTNLLQLFLSHGSVPFVILLCTLLPIVKDGLGDITSSENYRAIASGSLLLKLLDIVILLLEGEKLGCDQMQFGFQAKSSTTMCTWAATSVIDHFLSNGRNVFGCAMDLSKAFDMVEWTELFNTMMKRGVHPIFLRVLLYVYRSQQCDVKWAGKYSHRFSVSNGVRQGAVSSPILFSIYIDDLLKILRQSGLGCHITNVFFSCFGYADDLLLLSGSRSGLQQLIKICETFAKKKSLKFSTNPDPVKSKTKGIIFSRKKVDNSKFSPVLLNGDPLPWVSEVKHLGNTLQSDNSMQIDCSRKRGKFIGKLNSLSQEFHYVSPDVYVKILNVFATSFYGSNLWNLFSKDCEKIFASWNVAIRQCFDVDRQTHRYLIEDLSGSLHPKVMLCSRYSSFHNSLLRCDKFSVRFLARLAENDQRTVFGQTLGQIGNECKKNFPSKSEIKRKMKYFEVPNSEKYRLGLLRDLIGCKFGRLTLPDFSKNEVEEMLRFVCVS